MQNTTTYKATNNGNNETTSPSCSLNNHPSTLPLTINLGA